MVLADLAEYLPIIVPLVLLDLTLKVICLRSLIKFPEAVRGNRLIWAVVILVIQTLGPAAFLAFGRDRE